MNPQVLSLFRAVAQKRGRDRPSSVRLSLKGFDCFFSPLFIDRSRRRRAKKGKGTAKVKKLISLAFTS